MAEALVAFGIAAGVVQFIDFSTRLFSTGYRFGNSTHSSLHESQFIETTISDLQLVTVDLEKSLRQQQTSSRQLSQSELGLLDLASECQNAAAQLLAVLESLRPDGKTGKWNTLRAALRTVWKEDKIDSLQQKIDGFRQQLILRILMLFREQTQKSETAQSLVIDHVQKIDASIQGLGEKFLDLVQEDKIWRGDIIEAIYQDSASAKDRGLIPASSIQGGDKTRLQSKFLNQLEFNEMMDRHNRISEAHERTFQWLYHEPEEVTATWASFTHWLSSDSPLYWITGKAGSGKSTLMKYIYGSQRTFECLEAWCSDATLVTAAFFFWNSGTDMQMTQIGLLRSLLHQILSKCPALIPELFPQRWETYVLFGIDMHSWTLDELCKAFRLLEHQQSLNIKLCLFIDGLDEFNGDHTSLINLLHDIISSPTIKICVSSRPWVVFEDAFNQRSSLMLQDLTYRDIKQYVHSNFFGNPGFVELESREPEYASQLIEVIAQKAAGVFLWVNLVVSSLLAGLANGDRVSDLQRRLDLLPPDLENLYQKMLDSLDPFYLEHASQLFQLVRAALQPPTLLCLSLADEEEDFVFKSEVKPFGMDKLLSMANIMRRRLNSRCKGLLEVASGPQRHHGTVAEEARYQLGLNRKMHPQAEDDFRVIHVPEVCMADYTVQYLHRTVKDFIESPEVWDKLVDGCNGDYSPHLALLRSSISELKALSPKVLIRVTFWDAVRHCIRYATVLNKQRPGRYLVRLLDELDLAATELVHSIGPDGTTFARCYSPKTRLTLVDHHLSKDTRLDFINSIISAENATVVS